MREPETRLIGSVAYFPEKYCADLITVALDILHRRPVPPAVFVKHQLVTPDNVNHVYPNDTLLMVAAGAV
jgi:ribose transport system substrate-binding protein